MDKKKKSRKNSGKEAPPPIYTIIDGVRYVKPYVHEYSTSCKGRWLRRQILEVLTTEFGGHSPNYWVNAIATNRVLINNRPVDAEYVFCNSDVLVHKTHRHEPPVQGEIELVGETPDYVVVSKPSSMTMHPCGAYYHNSLMHILRYEPIVVNQPNLLLVHRLDRVTSGIVILAKTPAAARNIQDEIMGNRTKKTYLARVKGKFPKLLSKLKQLPQADLQWDHSEVRESAWGQGAEGADRKRSRSPSPPRDASDGPATADFAELSEAVYQHPEVGYGYNADGGLVLRCAVGVVSHRDGVHSNNPVHGKPAFTEFKLLGYSEADDTSVVECQPLTGRTHQIRLHLQLLGNPIANDPCYGGELFFGEPSKKEAAIDALKRIREMGKQPLGNVSHVLKLLADSDGAALPLVEPAAAQAVGGGPSKGPGTEGWALSEDSQAVAEAERQLAREQNETDEQYLTRSCRYCIGGLDEDIERVLHCDGIWLHALQYQGASWRFRTRLPSWAREVLSADSAHDHTAGVAVFGTGCSSSGSSGSCSNVGASGNIDDSTTCCGDGGGAGASAPAAEEVVIT